MSEKNLSVQRLKERKNLDLIARVFTINYLCNILVPDRNWRVTKHSLSTFRILKSVSNIKA